jgi:hypothetical protein
MTTFASIATRALTRRMAAHRPLILRPLATASKPKRENPEGPMLVGVQDHVDNLMARAEKIEVSLKELRDTYGKKQQAYLKLTMDPDDINGLYDFAGRQKEEIQQDVKAIDNRDHLKDEEVVQCTTIKWMDPDDIEYLFDVAGRQK